MDNGRGADWTEKEEVEQTMAEGSSGQWKRNRIDNGSGCIMDNRSGYIMDNGSGGSVDNGIEEEG